MTRSTKVLVPAGVLAAVMVAGACVPPPSPPTTGGPTTTTTLAPGVPHLYSENPLNGWSHNGTAYSVDIANNSVFVGGDFTTASRSGQTAPRANVMAVERNTGNLLPFVANTNGIVYAVISDGFFVYIGGDFTTINGVARPRLAKVNAATGAVDTSFNVAIPNTVTDLLLVGSSLYVTGDFGSVNGVARKGAALLNKANGAFNPAFAPNVQAGVNTVAINPAGSKLYLGLAGNSAPFLVEVNPLNGNAQGPSFNTDIKDYIRDVTVGPDGMVYVAAGGGMNSAIGLDPNSGRQRWRQRADGDVQAVKVSNGYVFFGFHDGFGGDNTLRILAANPATGALIPGFAPVSGSHPGVLTIDADGAYLAVGGLFGRMGGRAVKGLSIHP